MNILRSLKMLRQGVEVEQEEVEGFLVEKEWH